MAYAFAEIAFTPTVRDMQERNGSGSYAKFLSDERNGGDLLSDREKAFIEARDGFYQASVSETGWPYVQFRGGAPGFLRVLDETTVAYADLRGNRQYISLGNIAADGRVSLILMDYPNAQRLKIWGRAEILNAETMPGGDLPSGVERVVAIHVDAFDWNCPRHIPRRLTVEEFGSEIEALHQENAQLRAQLQTLTSVVSRTS